MQLSENVTLITHTNIYFESMLFLYFIMLYNALSSSLGFASDLEFVHLLFPRLPLPWLLYSIINSMSPVRVSSNGLFCAIVLLFIMLLFVLISIAACKWKMSKLLGFIMFLLYLVFLVVSVLLEDKVIVCPISV